MKTLLVLAITGVALTLAARYFKITSFKDVQNLIPGLKDLKSMVPDLKKAVLHN